MQSGCALWMHTEGCQGVMLPSDGDLECLLELQRGGHQGSYVEWDKKHVGVVQRLTNGEKTHCTQRDCVEWCGTEQEPGGMEQGL